MRPQLFLRLADRDWFWKVKQRIYNVKFRIARLNFLLSFTTRQQRESIGLLAQFARISTFSFLLTIAVTVLVHVSERFVSSWPISSPAPERYVSFMAVVAQIGGIFIGLFYAGVTAAAGAIYAQTPNTIRNLLVRERVGNVYMLFLTLVTFLPLALIAFEEGGKTSPPRLAIPLVALLAGVGIVSFAQLGRRAFDLFDPTKLSDTVFQEIIYWTDQVIPGGHQWQDKSFQAHANKRVNEALNALETIADYATGQTSLRREPFIGLTSNILKMLFLYTSKKPGIPSLSFWYERRISHPDWFKTSDSTTEIAHRTGTTIQAEEIPDKYWLENRLESIVHRCYEANTTAGALKILMEPSTYLVAYIRVLAEQGQTERASAFVAKFQHLLWNVLPSRGLTEADIVGFADFVGYLPIAVLLSVCTGLEQRTPEKHTEKLGKINWKRAKSVYRAGFTMGNLSTIEWLYYRIASEGKLEGRIVTPNWYCLSLLVKDDAQFVASVVPQLLAVTDVFLPPSKELATQHPTCMAALLSRSLEYLSKLDVHLQRIGQFYGKSSDSQKLSDLPFPKLKTEDWFARLDKERMAIHERVAHLIPMLFERVSDGSIPDYRGQFVELIAKDLFRRTVTGDTQGIKTLFPIYFSACFSIFDALRPAVMPEAHHIAESAFHVATAPLIDLLDLSGYILLFAEYHGRREIWSPVETLWKFFINRQEGALAQLAAIISMENIRFQIPHRGVLRTGISTEVHHILEALPRKVVDTGHFFSSKRIDHESPLVRYVGEHDWIDGVEIIVGEFLSKLPGGDALKWGRYRPEEFQEGVSRISDLGGDSDEE